MPDGRRVLGQPPSPPPFSTGYRSPGVLLASDIHGPYAAGYYTYDRTVQPPQYTYHPDYRHLRRQPTTCNTDLPDRSGSFDNAEKSFHRDVGQGNGGSSGMRNGDVEVVRSTLEDNDPVSAHNAFQNSKPASFEVANPGDSELRYQSNAHPSTDSSVRKDPPRKPKFTTFQATKKKVDPTNRLPKDTDFSKAKRKTSDLVGDDYSGWAATGAPRPDAFVFDALLGEVRMMESELGVPDKKTGFLRGVMTSTKPNEGHLPGTEKVGKVGKCQGNQSTPGAASNEREKFRTTIRPTASTNDGSVYLDQNKFNSKMREDIRKLGYSSPAELWSGSGDEPLSKRLGQLAVLSKMFEEFLSVYVEGSEAQRMVMRDAMKTMAQSAFRERVDGLTFSPVE
ncbi:hypothetical protein BFW01_g6279 [Lasiodiplodia theobromae]|nr:hypothetical protein BFW01_g6279 [Lasiodiplodia theobromae]